jgi:hypothetical protein
MSALLKMQEEERNRFKFKDDDDGFTELVNVVIEKVSNGYVTIWIYDNEDEVKEVFNNKDELLRELNKSL